MFSVGVILGLATSVFKSAKSISTKQATNSVNDYLTSFSIRFFSIPTFIIFLLLTNTFVKPDSEIFWIVLLINSFAMVVKTVLLTKAFAETDISLVSPMLGFVPVAVSIPSFILIGEVPSTEAAIGILLVSIGAYVLNISEADRGILEPIRSISTDRGVQYVAISLGIISFMPSLDKIGIQQTSPVTWVLLMHLTSATGILLIALYFGNNNKREEFRNNYKILFAVGFFSSMIWIVQAYAYTYVQVSYVQALKRFSLVISVIAGHYIFGEEKIKDRILASLIIIVGSVLVILGVN